MTVSLLSELESGSPVGDSVADYSGSLDFIDSLPERAPLRITHGLLAQRDALAIANALSSISDGVDVRKPRALLRGARLYHVNPSVLASDARDDVVLPDRRRWVPKDPYATDPEGDFAREHERWLRISRPKRNPFSSFNSGSIPVFGRSKSRWWICLKRHVRREVLASKNFFRYRHFYGRGSFRRNFTAYSLVRC